MGLCKHDPLKVQLESIKVLLILKDYGSTYAYFQGNAGSNNEMMNKKTNKKTEEKKAMSFISLSFQ